MKDYAGKRWMEPEAPTGLLHYVVQAVLLVLWAAALLSPLWLGA